MTIAGAMKKGVTVHEAWRTYKGVTLLTPKEGTGAFLVDMQGRVLHQWDVGYAPASGAELLPNGNLLYSGKTTGSSGIDAGAGGGIVLELDWRGRVVWEHEDLTLHHGAFRMRSGNTLVLKRTEVPESLAEEVQGGLRESGKREDQRMWADVVHEINPRGEVVWEWVSHEHLDPTVDRICPICRRDTWGHANAVLELADGSVLVSFLKTNTLAIIDKRTQDIIWRWGDDELAHQNCPSELNNGNILVFDNGFHMRGFNFGYSRVLEIDRCNGKMVWAYTGGGGSMLHFLYSATMCSAQRLPNGNTLVCESTTGRLLEVTADGHLVWEYLNGLPAIAMEPSRAHSCMVYAAYRYGPDYSGLVGEAAGPEQKQFAPGAGELLRGPRRKEDDKEEAIRSRLEALGY